MSKRRSKKYKYRRNGHYRSSFFRANSTGDVRRKYRCVYCGTYKKDDNITVDHLVPVTAVDSKFGMSRMYYRGLLKRMGCIKGVNDPRNLVAACHSCNQKKGSKAGLWVLRGRLGRHGWYWNTRRVVTVAALVAVALFALAFI